MPVVRRRLLPALALVAGLLVPVAPSPARADEPAARSNEPAVAAVPARPAAAVPAAVPRASDGLGRVYLSEEIMRLTNLDRVALGRARLTPDPILSALARDLGVPCPGKPTLVLRGRSRDMTDRRYFSHTVPGCRTKSGAAVGAAQLAAKLGFTGWTVFGENIAWIMGSAGTKTYATGCASGRSSGCRGTTSTALVIAAIQRMWMNSRDHRKNILDTRYTRFGCGAWHKAGSTTVYATCIFARGGSTPVDKVAPVFSGVSVPDAPLAADGAFTFAATATDARMPVAFGAVSVDGVVRASWGYDDAAKTRSLSWPVSAAALAPGEHRLTWTVRDAGGTTATASVPFIVAAPESEGDPTPAP